MKILVTGGTGYIGSHTCVELMNSGYEIVVVDNFSNSKEEVVDRIKTIANKDFLFYKGNICDENVLEKIFSENEIGAVVHFGGFKAIGESVNNPLKYYDNNLVSTISLCKTMNKYNCKKIVFSSSATVYGAPKKLSITEDMSLSTTNPYGTTKLMNEQILTDVYKSDKEWGIELLRYFNPIGAHASGLIGEDPHDIPNNLMPYIVKVAIGELDHLNIFGDDYNTNDGTGVRDYIHVVDLAKAHVKVIEKLLSSRTSGLNIYNLGTGTGYSVLEVVNTFSRVNNVQIPYVVTARRPGDVAACYADPSKAFAELNWKAENGLEEMCRDAYNFAVTNITKI